jgi:hypothetical protein
MAMPTVVAARFLLLWAVGLPLALLMSDTAFAFPIAAPGTEGLEVAVSGTGPVIATYQGNSALFSNDLYLMLDGSDNPGDDGNSANDLFIFNNHASPVGSTVTLGSFPAGTKLIFRLHVNDTNTDYYTGQASRNPDNQPHVRAQANWLPDETLVSFEDLLNGPFDYNDLSFSFVPTTATIPDAPFTFNVDSTRGWQTTTLKVTAGQQLSFSTVGVWNVDYRNFPYVSPDGYPPEVDSTIFQGCKLDPSVPYGQLLARVGDDPSFEVIGSGGTFTADRDGFLAFRIHDADGCLGDNADSVRVTVTGSGIEAAPIAPIFYCITGPGKGGGCMEVYKNPVPSELPPVPGFLTSQHGPQCVSALYTHLSILLTLGSIVNPALVPFAAAIALPAAADVIIDTTFVAKRVLDEFEPTIEPQLMQTGGITDGRYWGILIQESLRLGACDVIDTITLQACHDLLAELFQKPPEQVLPVCE